MKLILFTLCIVITTYCSGEGHIRRQSLVGAYTSVDISKAETDPVIKSVLDFGVNQILDEAVKAKRVDSTEFTVSNVYSIYQQVVAGINYKFDVDLADNNGCIINAQFIVYDVPWKSKREITFSTYSVEDSNRSPN